MIKPSTGMGPWPYLVTGILLVLCLGGALYWLKDRRNENERHAASALDWICSAELDFRANDRDENRVNDFWTADVAGLFNTRPRSTQSEIHLIERTLAQADAAPLKPVVHPPIPYHGYYFVALDEEDAVPVGSSERSYKLHPTSKFGFCAYPAHYGSTGHWTYIVNEYNVVYRFDTGGKAFRCWPSNPQSRSAERFTPSYFRD